MKRINKMLITLTKGPLHFQMCKATHTLDTLKHTNVNKDIKSITYLNEAWSFEQLWSKHTQENSPKPSLHTLRKHMLAQCIMHV